MYLHPSGCLRRSDARVALQGTLVHPEVDLRVPQGGDRERVRLEAVVVESGIVDVHVGPGKEDIRTRQQKQTRLFSTGYKCLGHAMW